MNLGFTPHIAELRDETPARAAAILQSLNLPDAVSKARDGLSAPGTLLPVVASRDGVVLQANVVAGELVDASKVLFAVADPRVLRLTLHVRPDEAHWVRIGQSARFRPDGSATDVTGQVSWVGVNADETTRHRARLGRFE